MDELQNGWAGYDGDWVVVNTRGTVVVNHISLIPRAEWDRASVAEREAVVRAQRAEAEEEQEKIGHNVLADGFGLMDHVTWAPLPPLDDGFMT